MCDHALAHASMEDYGTPYGRRIDDDKEVIKKEIENYHERKFTWEEICQKWPEYRSLNK